MVENNCSNVDGNIFFGIDFNIFEFFASEDQVEFE